MDIDNRAKSMAAMVAAVITAKARGCHCRRYSRIRSCTVKERLYDECFHLLFTELDVAFGYLVVASLECGTSNDSSVVVLYAPSARTATDHMLLCDTAALKFGLGVFSELHTLDLQAAQEIFCPRCTAEVFFCLQDGYHAADYRGEGGQLSRPIDPVFCKQGLVRFACAFEMP